MLLDTALANMSQGLCMFDADGHILLFNERYVELMDRMTGMPLQGRLLVDVLRRSEGGRRMGRRSRRILRQGAGGSRRPARP